MGTALYLTLEEALALHAALIARHGGAPGVRDMGLVESALARARSGYYESLSEQAAALLQSFAMNHAFVDGNKRAAFLAVGLFLALNGQWLVASQAEATLTMLAVAAGQMDEATFARWLRDHARPR